MMFVNMIGNAVELALLRFLHISRILIGDYRNNNF